MLKILKMQADGLAKRLDHAHAKTAVIGISGGLDSCLALLVAVRAMKQLHRPAADDGQGLLSGLQHHIQIQPEAQRTTASRRKRAQPGTFLS